MARHSPFAHRAQDVTLSIEDENNDVEHHTAMYTSRRMAPCLGEIVEFYKYGRNRNIAVNPKNHLAYEHDETKDDMNLTGNPDAYTLMGTVLGLRKGHEPNEDVAEYADADLRPRPNRPSID